MKNKLFTIFVLFTFIMSYPLKINAQEADYEQVVAGDCIKEDGFFFTQAGISKLAANVDQKIKLAVLEKVQECQKCSIDLETCKKSKEIELKIQKEMFDNQLLVKQQTIDLYKNEIFWNNIKYSAGGLFLGLTIGIFTTVLIYVNK